MNSLPILMEGINPQRAYSTTPYGYYTVSRGTYQANAEDDFVVTDQQGTVYTFFRELYI